MDYSVRSHGFNLLQETAKYRFLICHSFVPSRKNNITRVPREGELLRCFAAVDEVGSPRDEGGFVGGEKDDSLGNLFRSSHAF